MTTKFWTGDKSYIVLPDPPDGISDEALLCFARWCRLNDARLVLDPVVLRRVFDAYTEVAP